MSRHSFALSVLFCTLASLLLFTPAHGQIIVMIFDDASGGYSDCGDYNDYRYVLRDEAEDWESIHYQAAQREAEQQEMDLDEMANYGCAGYSDEMLECDCYEMLFEGHFEPAADSRAFAPDGLIAEHDAVYDYVVYGHGQDAVSVGEFECDAYETYCWFTACGEFAAPTPDGTSIDSETARFVEEMAVDTVAMINDTAAHVAAAASQLDLGSTRRISGELKDAAGRSLELVRQELTEIEVSTSSSTHEQVLLETAETLESAAEALRNAADQLRRMAGDDRITWRSPLLRR